MLFFVFFFSGSIFGGIIGIFLYFYNYGEVSCFEGKFVCSLLYDFGIF